MKDSLKPCTSCGKLVDHKRLHPFEEQLPMQPARIVAELCDECCPNCFGGVGVGPSDI